MPVKLVSNSDKKIKKIIELKSAKSCMCEKQAEDSGGI